MADPVDHYSILRIGPDATPAQIGHAYRALMRAHHPDTAGTAQGTGTRGTASAGSPVDAIRDIQDAYAVLRSPARRASYDRGRRRTPRTPEPRAGSPEGTRANGTAPAGAGSQDRRTGSNIRVRVNSSANTAGPVRIGTTAAPPSDFLAVIYPTRRLDS